MDSGVMEFIVWLQGPLSVVFTAPPTMTETQTLSLVVPPGSHRLDRLLAEEFPELSRSLVQKLILQGQVTINDAVCTKKQTKVHPGDRLTVIIPPPTALVDVEPENIPLEILYEDDQLVIINKPPNLVVHPAPGHPHGTLVNALLFHFDHLAGIGGVQRPGIVHRLDKDTTGAIVVAKTDLAHHHLQGQIQAKTARREYLAVTYGNFPTDRGTIDLPIGRHPVDRKKQAIIPLEKGGRPAVTHWQVKERFGNYSLVHFKLETGRTHQIRVHSSHQGHPIVGDPLYSAGRSLGVNLTGQALHAWKLTLQHPLTGETIEAIAPLPSELTKLLTVLRQRQKSS